MVNSRQRIVYLALTLSISVRAWHIFNVDRGTLEQDYRNFNNSEKLRLLNATKHMFYFGYDGYMKYAYPYDELDPLNCKGRGPDPDRWVVILLII